MNTTSLPNKEEQQTEGETMEQGFFRIEKQDAKCYLVREILSDGTSYTSCVFKTLQGAKDYIKGVNYAD